MQAAATNEIQRLKTIFRLMHRVTVGTKNMLVKSRTAGSSSTRRISSVPLRLVASGGATEGTVARGGGTSGRYTVIVVPRSGVLSTVIVPPL